jgi:recombination protein RecA
MEENMNPKTDKTVKTDRNSAERSKSLGVAMEQITKQYGKGAIMRLGDSKLFEDIEVIPSGSFELDEALGIGGYPRGRIVEIYGQESSGKTTLALHAVANSQKAGGVAAFVDAEHALDPQYAKAIGVDIENLLIAQPSCGEEALEIVDTLVRSGGIDIIVVDSVAALTPRAELEGEMGESQMGLQARLLSQAMRKLTASISKSKTCAIFLNQIRHKIGGYGNPEITTGGNALKFYASVRLEIRRIENITRGEESLGSMNKVKVAKNKVAAPFRIAIFEISYGSGISYEASLLSKAVEMEIIRKAGTWFSYGDLRLGQGKENVKTYLKEHPELLAEIEKLIRAKPKKSADKAKPEAEIAEIALEKE